MRQKAVQSHCNHVRRQRFHNKRALTLTRYEAFGAFQLGMGFAHPTITKFLPYLRKEQSFTENRIARIRAGEILLVNAKVERHCQRLQELLNHYQNNSLLSDLEGVSFNFDF